MKAISYFSLFFCEIGNGAEYVISTIDKIVNWARQGSIWPMVSPILRDSFQAMTTDRKLIRMLYGTHVENCITGWCT
jgi:hypothetical protein